MAGGCARRTASWSSTASHRRRRSPRAAPSPAGLAEGSPLRGLASAAPGPLLAAFGLLVLDLGAVEEDQLDELGRGPRQEHRAAEALPHDDGQQPAVVEVGMRDEDGVDLAGS